MREPTSSSEIEPGICFLASKIVLDLIEADI